MNGKLCQKIFTKRNTNAQNIQEIQAKKYSYESKKAGFVNMNTIAHVILILYKRLINEKFILSDLAYILDLFAILETKIVPNTSRADLL